VYGPQPVAILTSYEERRRIQERVLQWDAADYQDGNVGAARQVYEYAANKGWAPAALALAFTYDPHELRRRGVAIAPNPAKARACYIKARDLMNIIVAFYLSRLERGRDESC
jgi:TPR repeat protein